MATYDIDESEFLGSFVRKQNKYGATSSNSSQYDRQYKCLTHYVQPGDTLQGLSLRYGVPMEHIKRANKMWTSDSLFLRPTLNIPIMSEDASFGTSLASTPSNGHSLVSSAEHGSEKNRPTHSSQNSSTDCDEISLNSPSTSHPTPRISSIEKESPSEKPEESVTDFLMRIDSSISRTKSQVTQCAKLSEHDGDKLEDFLRTTNGRTSGRLTNNHRKKNGSSTSLASNGSGDHTVITRGRKVKSSLRRLAKEQDEIYEL